MVTGIAVYSRVVGLVNILPGQSKDTVFAPYATNPNILERGDIFFFYRPDVEEESPGRLLDVRRFHVVLRPEGKAAPAAEPRIPGGEPAYAEAL